MLLRSKRFHFSKEWLDQLPDILLWKILEWLGYACNRQGKWVTRLMMSQTMSFKPLVLLKHYSNSFSARFNLGKNRVIVFCYEHNMFENNSHIYTFNKGKFNCAKGNYYDQLIAEAWGGALFGLSGPKIWGPTPTWTRGAVFKSQRWIKLPNKKWGLKGGSRYLFDEFNYVLVL